MNFTAEISTDLLDRVRGNLPDVDDEALVLAGVRALSEASPELRIRAEAVPHGGGTRSISVELADALFSSVADSLEAAEPTVIAHLALGCLLLQSSAEEDIDVRDGEGINSQVFGRFLVEREAVNLKMLMKALRLARSMGARIGDLAVAQGMLTLEQVEQVSQEQESSDKPFGLAAIALKLLSQAQVYDLLDLQKQSKGGIGEALVQLGFVSGEAMQSYFSEFQSAQEGEAAHPEEDLSESVAGKHLLKFLTDSFADLAKTIAGIVVKVEPPVAITAATAVSSEFTAQMNMQGDASCLLTLSVSNDFARVIMWGLFGMDFVESVDMYPDAVGEFLNMLVGNASRALEKEGIKTRGEAPSLESTIPDHGRCFQFVISGQIRGTEVHPVAPTATGTLFLSTATS